MKRLALFAAAVAVFTTAVMGDTYTVVLLPDNGVRNVGYDHGSIVQQLQSGYLQLGLGNVTLQEVTTDLWFGDGATSVLVEECAGLAPINSFGYYVYKDGSPVKNELLVGGAGSGANASFVLDPAQNFGFYLGANESPTRSGYPPNFWFSESSLNRGDGDHLVVFQDLSDPNVYILGWEDLPLRSGDKDYQDMVLKVTINTIPVPEPSSLSLMLLGMAGLIGLGLARRKK